MEFKRSGLLDRKLGSDEPAEVCVRSPGVVVDTLIFGDSARVLEAGETSRTATQVLEAVDIGGQPVEYLTQSGGGVSQPC